jgi:hypothetical protein
VAHCGSLVYSGLHETLLVAVLERDLRCAGARWLGRLEQRVDADRSGEPVFRTFL